MPADVSAAAVALSRQRRIGLRVALAVAAGFTWNLATGEVIPFFGPVLAVQFLILGAGPLPLSKAVAFVGLVLVVGQAFIVLNLPPGWVRGGKMRPCHSPSRARRSLPVAAFAH